MTTAVQLEFCKAFGLDGIRVIELVAAATRAKDAQG